jgi:ribonuclease HI
MNIEIYTDGACSGNPGIGGWGVVILKNTNDKIYLNGGLHHTTNNQMELFAAIEGIGGF